MAASWPLVKRRLVALLPTLDGWSTVAVYNGWRVTGDSPAEFCTVGYVDGEDFGGSYEQTRNGEAGWQGALEESGTVRCELVLWSGDDVLPELEARAFALVDAWEAEISRDETLGGVLPPSSSASLTVDVQPQQKGDGPVQRLTVTLSYFSRR
jgi:hypothetical protein